MMKGVMMSATVSVSNVPTTGQSGSADKTTEANTQVVTALVNAGKQTSVGSYTVTVRKIEPFAGSNQVRATFFVTGDDEPAHDFTEMGRQVVSALLNAGMHANVSGAGAATVEQIEAVEGGDDDSDDDSDTDALSGLVNDDDPPKPPARPPDAQ